MPLQKTISSPYGVNAVYWKLSEAKLDFVNSTTLMTIDGYPNKTAADAKAVSLQRYIYNADSLIPTTNAAYTYIKTAVTTAGGMMDNPLLGATDVS